MKITKDNYEEFYFGEASERFIQSEFYSQGYEATKMSPDIGYDLLVTNCARTKFLGEEPRQYNIQVKSRVCYEKKVCFYIDETEYDSLIGDKNSYLVCVLCKPEISDGRENIVQYRDLTPKTISNMCESWEIEVLKDKDFLSIDVLKELGISFVGYTRQYVWFNSTQLNRLKDENIAYKITYEDKERWCINIDISSMMIIDRNDCPCGVSSNSLYNEAKIGYEQQHIKYLVDCDSESNGMFEGDYYL